MRIQCKNCGHIEETNLRLFIRIIGGAMPFGGYWAWVTYLFAGTGFAMAIVIAIIAGGTAMLMYQNEIVEWICEKGYECPECHKNEWKTES